MILKCFGTRLFFLTIPKPPCPLVPYVAGGSNSTRFLKKDYPFRSTSWRLIYWYFMCSQRAFSLNDIGGLASSFQ